MTDDPHNLARFVIAQDPVYPQVLAELQQGQKQTHWMWFIFPQIAGLGRSPTARHFAIAGREEAEAYHAHPLLGARLHDCAGLLLGHYGLSAHAIFGTPDHFKLRSSMTLFAAIAPDAADFAAVLRRYFGGAPDPATLARL